MRFNKDKRQKSKDKKGVITGLLILALCLLSLVSNAQLYKLDSIPQYKFVRYDLNKISVKDSTTLALFYDKLWNYEQNEKGKVKILQIGDSHVQAGYWTGEVREQIHKSFGCGTTERGFIFPYGMAQTNGPLNYGAKYSGDWTGCRSSHIKQGCDWGVSGIVATTKDDSTTLKVYTNNHTFDPYWFDKIKLFHKDDSSSFEILVRPHGTELMNTRKDTTAGYTEYIFGKETDTVYFTFLKEHGKEAEFIMQGLTLENSRPGVCYSEIGVNGAEVPSYLACSQFDPQLKALKPDLVILSLGTNDTYNTRFNDSIFELRYDSLIQHVKKSLPLANILLTTPGDCKRYRKRYIKENIDARRIIFKLAKKHNCAVWDFFNIMGGYKSMDQWYTHKLTSRDRVHLNEKGYELQGMLFYNALAESYAQYTNPLRPKTMKVDEGKDYEEFIKGLFVYNPKEPLFFNTYTFWGFFSIIFVVFSLIYKKFAVRNIFLFFTSLFIYYKAGGYYFVILIFSTFSDFFIGKFIYEAKEKSSKKLLVALSLFLNLGVLAFFKYSGFVLETFNGIAGTNFEAKSFFGGINWLFGNSHAPSNKIFSVVGISFFTFQTISYAIDIYRERIEPVKNIIDFGFYVAFFPQLVAGPIVRANEFIPQIYKPYQLSLNSFSRACFLIVGGLFKKIVISDFISVNFVDRVFETPIKYSGFETLMSIYGYALQIYCDFSAYSDIAIGIALLLGFTLPPNFNKPYLSSNITLFWRNWHMSLSRWLKDYLYIPLGGNRKGKFRTYVNLYLTMLLGGIWHGAGLNFIIWGALHGKALALHKLYSSIVPEKVRKNFIARFFGWILTFHFVCFCWIFFRATDIQTVQTMLEQMAYNFRADKVGEMLIAYKEIFAMMAFGYLLHLIPDKWEINIQGFFTKLKMPAIGVTIVVMVFLIYQFKTSGNQPFIYFQF